MDSNCIDERNGGFTYAGTVNHTIDGTPCQRWDTATPHAHSQGAQYFPEKNLSTVENYCRNPDREIKAWCYTMDPGKRWQFCDVPYCGNLIIT